ncbi:MAG: HsdR family type I site-specific deoxyribonuclease [Bacteroidales bacterium]|nr:HsdR family type I site-specific deoxyribonuclease [Bacteroidales bacterium]
MTNNPYISAKERKYQDTVIKLFQQELGYTYLGSWQYGQEDKCRKNGEVNSPICEEELRSFLTDAKKYTPTQIEEAISQVKKEALLTDSKKGVLLDTNNSLYETLITHIPIQPSPDKPHENVALFDFANPQANRFAIAEEVSYIDPLTGKHSRPDIVVYVNGIALAVIELKRSTVSLSEGIKQHLSNEIDLIPSFFTTVQFTIAANPSNGTGDKDLNGFKYATILTPAKFWTPWKKDNHQVGTLPSDRESYLDFFDKTAFMQFFRYGVIDDGGTKKVMRPHQFHALRAAMPRLAEKASGVIWHSQGSGKSLTMVWLAKYIQRNFENPRVLIITDRTELDIQIANTFTKTSGAIYRAKTSDDLLNVLHGGTEWLVCSLIHKFGRHIDPKTGKEIIGDDDAPIPLEAYLKELTTLVNSKFGGKFKAKGTHKFVFVDECHRTQSGRLHEAMRAIMGEDVMFIGFTGTPLLHDDKKRGYQSYTSIKNESRHRFGEFIHKYLHKEAVDDKVILDLQYEARDVEQQIPNQEKLNEKKEQLLSGVTEENKKAVEDRWATLKNVYSCSERIERIGYSILDDMAQYPLSEDWCNAMLVAGDIQSAYRYYEFFTKNSGNQFLKGKCAVVTSYTPSDNDKRKISDGDDSAENALLYKNAWAKQSYADAGVKTAEEYEAWAKRQFIQSPSRMKLLIVVDKLLTGFDAPSATYLYIDKDMRDHNLFQAICRVNRLGVDFKVDPKDPESQTIFSHKEFGLIVDFKHLFDKIEDAITNFNDANGGLGGYDPADIDELLTDAITKNKKRLNLWLQAYQNMKADWESQGISNADDVVRFFCPEIPLDLTTEERKAMEAEQKAQRELFYKITQGLCAAYASLCDYILRAGYSEEQAKEIHQTVAEAANLNARVKQASGDLFDVRQFDPQMRVLLDRFIRADDAETIIPPTADFSFLDLITAESDTEEETKKVIQAAGGKEKAAAEVIEARARAVINDWNARDPEQALNFAARLQKIIDDLNQETHETAKRIRDLIDLLKAMKSVNKAPEGITTPFARSLWNNRKAWTKLTDKNETVELINKVEVYFATKVFAGFKGENPRSRFACIQGLKKLCGNACTADHINEIHRLASANL